MVEHRCWVLPVSRQPLNKFWSVFSGHSVLHSNQGWNWGQVPVIVLWACSFLCCLSPANLQLRAWCWYHLHTGNGVHSIMSISSFYQPVCFVLLSATDQSKVWTQLLQWFFFIIFNKMYNTDLEMMTEQIWNNIVNVNSYLKAICLSQRLMEYASDHLAFSVIYIQLKWFGMSWTREWGKAVDKNSTHLQTLLLLLVNHCWWHPHDADAENAKSLQNYH